MITHQHRGDGTVCLSTTKRWSGTVGRYKTIPADLLDGQPDTLALLLTPIKPRKARPKADRRAYPKFREGDSTAEYARAYFRLNTERSTMRYKSAQIHAYDDAVDHLALYHPLSTARQYSVIDAPIEWEIIE